MSAPVAYGCFFSGICPHSPFTEKLSSDGQLSRVCANVQVGVN